MNHFNTIISACRELLTTLPEAAPYREYLNNRLSPETQDKFQFGYFPSFDQLHILPNIIGDEQLAQTKLIYDKYIDGHKERHGVLEQHNLVMPYKNTYGEIIAIVGRTILSEEERTKKNLAKYKNTSFQKGEYLFGLSDAKRSIAEKNFSYIVEGQFDTIKAMEKGVYNIVGIGSSNMSYEQFALLSRYTTNLILLLDNDEAGRHGCSRIMEYYGKLANIKVGKLPEGVKDLDEYLEIGNIEDITV